MTGAAQGIKTSTWVNIVLAGFFAWALIICGVIFFTAKASYIEYPPPAAKSQYPEIEKCDLPLWDRIRFKCPKPVE